MNLFVYGWPSTGYSSTLFSAHSHFSRAGFLRRLLWELHVAHVRLLSSVSIMFGTRICLVLASRSIARGGSVAGSPKVHGGDCLIRLHTMTVLLDFTQCSPSCSSYIRRTFVHLSCTYNQLAHSHQQMFSVWYTLRCTILITIHRMTIAWFDSADI